MDEYYQLTKNIIAFQKGMIVFTEDDLETTVSSLSKQMAYTIQAELIHHGYMLEKEALDELCKAKESYQILFYSEIISYLKHIHGCSLHRPLYDKFPHQLVDMDKMKLIDRCISFYENLGKVVPIFYWCNDKIAFKVIEYKESQ